MKKLVSETDYFDIDGVQRLTRGKAYEELRRWPGGIFKGGEMVMVRGDDYHAIVMPIEVFEIECFT